MPTSPHTPSPSRAASGANNRLTGRKIAVIGSGIAGHGAAWALARHTDVTLFEKEAKFGGHASTADVTCDGYRVPVDMGFIVYNQKNYPQLVNLLGHLNVATEASNMSFAVSLDGGRYEYHGAGIKGAFAQRRNMASPGHIRMLLQLLDFYKTMPGRLDDPRLNDITLGDLLDEMKLGRWFRDKHIVPMAACIWSASAQEILAFPAAAFVRFFQNHGLFALDPADRPAWRTISGGSRSYVKALHAGMAAARHSACPVSAIERTDSGVTVHSSQGAQTFDEVVIATHGDTALSLLANPTQAERDVLGAFRYSDNDVILHTDTALMPKRRDVWSSWNYVAPSTLDPAKPVPMTYWMNRLQNLPSNQDIFVTLNPLEEIDAAHVQCATNFSHPIFDSAAYAAQPKLQSLQGDGGIWYAGSYFGYGFHEDALSSGLDAARAMGALLPWEMDSDALAAE